LLDEFIQLDRIWQGFLHKNMLSLAVAMASGVQVVAVRMATILMPYPSGSGHRSKLRRQTKFPAASLA
jgi:hypothetical protein